MSYIYFFGKSFPRCCRVRKGGESLLLFLFFPLPMTAESGEKRKPRNSQLPSTKKRRRRRNGELIVGDTINIPPKEYPPIGGIADRKKDLLVLVSLKIKREDAFLFLLNDEKLFF